MPFGLDIDAAARLRAIASERGKRSGAVVDRPSGLSVSRRRFLKAGLASGFVPVSAQADGGFRVERTSEGFRVLQGGRVLWIVNCSWICSPSLLRIGADLSSAEIVLRDVSFPGTSHPADFCARIARRGDRLELCLEHFLAGERGEVDLVAWTEGRQQLRLVKRGATFVFGAKDFVQVSQQGDATYRVLPDLSLQFAGVFKLDGAVEGKAKELTVGPVDTGTCLIPASPGSPTNRSMRVTIVSATNAPLEVRSIKLKGEGPDIGRFGTDRLILDARERPNGRPAFAYFAQPVGSIPLRDVRAGSGVTAAMLAREALLAKSSDGAVVLQADAVIASAREGDYFTRWSGSGPGTLRLISSGDICQLECQLGWQRGELLRSNRISTTLSRRTDLPKPSSGEGVGSSNFEWPWRQATRRLDGSELSFFRADDGLWLRFRFRDCELVRTLSGPKIRTLGPNARFWLVFPPQSVSEQAYFRGPENCSTTSSAKWMCEPKGSTPSTPFGVAPPSEDNRRRREFQEKPRGVATSTETCRSLEDVELLPHRDTASKARVSGESVLCFRPTDRGGVDTALKIEALLRSSSWRLEVHEAAFSSIEAWRDKSDTPGSAARFPPAPIAKTLDEATHIELPWRLHLSPDENTALEIGDLEPAEPNSFRPLFFVAPVAGAPRDSSVRPSLPLRAIYSPDAHLEGDAKAPLQPHFGSQIAEEYNSRLPPGSQLRIETDRRQNLDERDRHELVRLTGRWGQKALLGSSQVFPDPAPTARNDYGIYRPEPLHAEALRLTAFGGTMRSLGNWDPPSLDRFALSIEEWAHRSSEARSHYDRVLYRGYVVPLGHRCVLIKLTRRELGEADGRGAVAAPIQRFFIRILEPSLRYPLTGAPSASVNAFLHSESIEILQQADLLIDDPAKSQLAGRGPSAFVISVCEQPYPFELKLGATGRGTCRLAFVDNEVVHNYTALKCVCDEYNDSPKWQDLRAATVFDAPLQFAPSRSEGDTTLPTKELELRAVVNKEIVNSTVLEAARRAPFYPSVARAKVVVRAIAVQTGGSVGAVDVKYNELYKAVGFDGGGNAAELYLNLIDEVPLSFRNRRERSGGVANADQTARALSRKSGVAMFTEPPAPTAGGQVTAMTLGAVQQQFSSSLVFDRSAKLLGAVPIVDLLGYVGLDELPALIEKTQLGLAEAQERLTGGVAAFVDKAVPIVEKARDTIAESCGSTTAGWCSSPQYKELTGSLDALVEDLAKVSKNPTIEGFANAGRDLVRTKRVVERIANAPEFLLTDLLAADSLKPLLDWIRKLASARKELLALVESIETQAKQIRDGLKKRAEDAATAAVEDLRARSDQLTAQALELAYKFLQSIEAAVTAQVAALDQIVTAIAKVGQEFTGLYDLYLGVFDQLEDAKQLCKAAVDGFEKRAMQLGDEISRIPESALAGARRKLFTEASAWDELVSKCLPPSDSASADRMREVEPHLRRIRDVLLVIEDKKLATSFSFFGLVNLGQLLLGAMRDCVAVMNSGATCRNLSGAFDKARADIEGALILPQQVGAALRDVQQAASELANCLQPSQTALLMYLRQLHSPQGPSAVAALAPSQRLDAISSLAPLVKCLSRPTESEKLACLLQDWPLYNTSLEVGVEIAGLAYGPLRALANEIDEWIRTNLQGVRNEPLVRSVFGDNFVESVSDLQLRAQTLALAMPPKSPALAAQWFRAASEFADQFRLVFERLDPAAVLEGAPKQLINMLRDELIALAAQLIPTRVSTSHHFSRELQGTYASGVFKTGLSDGGQSSFNLDSFAEVDLLGGSARFSLDGTLKTFRINIFSLIELGCKEVHFEASSERGFRLSPPDFEPPNFGTGPLSFLGSLGDLVGARNGLFVEPRATGITAGYRFSKDYFLLGPMTCQNLSFELALTIPFDDRAAEISASVGSRDAPVLLSVAPYGGGGYFAMVMAGDRVVSIDASFEYGLVGAFNLTAVKGQGRVTVGLFYRQAASGAILEGFFYAGGHATVLRIVSISADLNVRVGQQGSRAGGTGRFGVSIGAGPFKWTLHYSVSYSAGAEVRALGEASTTSLAARVNTLPVAYQVKPSDLTNLDVWAEYQRAFIPARVQ